MSNVGLSVDETDTVYVVYTVRVQGLAAQWKPYETVTESIGTAVGTTLTTVGGSTATKIGQVVPAIDSALDALINVLFPDRDAQPSIIVTQFLPDLKPINSVRSSESSDGSTNFFVRFRISRDDQDWRWDTESVTVTPPALAPNETGQVQVVLHNVGRQSFAPDNTSLLPVVPQSPGPAVWTEDLASPWIPTMVDVVPDAPADPGDDLTFTFPVTVPSSATPGTSKWFNVMPRINDRTIGLIPGESPFGGPLTITIPIATKGPLKIAQARATGPIPGGVWWKFSASDPTTGQVIPDSEVSVLLNGAPGGTAASPYRVTTKLVGKPPNGEIVIVPDISLVALGYTPTGTGL
jgi:hypothetical protein